MAQTMKNRDTKSARWTETVKNRCTFGFTVGVSRPVPYSGWISNGDIHQGRAPLCAQLLPGSSRDVREIGFSRARSPGTLGPVGIIHLTFIMEMETTNARIKDSPYRCSAGVPA